LTDRRGFLSLEISECRLAQSFTLSVNVICEIHFIILTQNRGVEKLRAAMVVLAPARDSGHESSSIIVFNFLEVF
jgi:hypothetical protein